jgi:hypothetical protein
MRAYYLHRGESPNLAVQISLVEILFSSLLLLFVSNLCYRRTSSQEGLSKMVTYNLPDRMQNSPQRMLEPQSLPPSGASSSILTDYSDAFKQKLQLWWKDCPVWMPRDLFQKLLA